MHRMKCAEVWGGVKNIDVDVCSTGVTVSLYSSSCYGGKGGDVYFFSVCNADRVSRVVLADVVGHGETVSRMSEWVYDQLAARLDDPDLPAMLGDLNDRVSSVGFGAMTTAVVLSYYVDLKEVYYCYAGHPPILARRTGDRWAPLVLKAEAGAANLPLGVQAGSRYSMDSAAFGEGDLLFLYSDGVFEAPRGDGEMFGQDRLLRRLATAKEAEPMALKNRVLSGVRDWTSGRLVHDDVTLIAIQLH